VVFPHRGTGTDEGVGAGFRILSAVGPNR